MNEDDGEWLSLWIKGQAALFAGDYGAAIASFESLAVKPLTANSVQVLAALGQSYYLQGEGVFECQQIVYCTDSKCMDEFHVSLIT